MWGWVEDITCVDVVFRVRANSSRIGDLSETGLDIWVVKFSWTSKLYFYSLPDQTSPNLTDTSRALLYGKIRFQSRSSRPNRIFVPTGPDQFSPPKSIMRAERSRAANGNGAQEKVRIYGQQKQKEVTEFLESLWGFSRSSCNNNKCWHSILATSFRWILLQVSVYSNQ